MLFAKCAAEGLIVVGAGEGTMSGFIPRRSAAPAMPTRVERKKPVRERSRRYQITGFTRARVRET